MPFLLGRFFVTCKNISYAIVFILTEYNKKQMELFPFCSWGTYSTDMKGRAKVVQKFYNAATVWFLDLKYIPSSRSNSFQCMC